MQPDDAGLQAAVNAINAGQPIVVPTDTVYGIAVRAGDADALERVFALKRRPVERSIAVLVSDVEQAGEFAQLNEYERRVVDSCWPGALTLVLSRLESADPSIGRDDGTVGVRCPNDAFVRRLALTVGPLATTSANISGEPTPVEAAPAAESLDGTIDVIIDGGRLAGQASTVARVDHHGDITVFRAGEYSQEDLESIVAKNS